MKNQSELATWRGRLLATLRERLSEMQDDEARQAAWEATTWDLVVGVACNECGRDEFRLLEGLCVKCRREKEEGLHQQLLERARRLLELTKAKAAAERARYELDGTMNLRDARRALGIDVIRRRGD